MNDVEKNLRKNIGKKIKLARIIFGKLIDLYLLC